MTFWAVPPQGPEPAKVHDEGSIGSPAGIDETWRGLEVDSCTSSLQGWGPDVCVKWAEEGSRLQREMPVFKTLEAIAIRG